MFDSIKQMLGIAPQATENGFSPSPIALKLATKSTTDYQPVNYTNLNSVKDPSVLVVCTEENNMTMKNGKAFLTGNHPVELFVPLLHLRRAGFTIDICTPTGKPVALEHWAMPEQDEAVKGIYERFKDALEHPKSLADIAETAVEKYIGLFIPGGHGAMLGLPENEYLGNMIKQFHQHERFVLAICHGPAALLSAKGEGDYLYQGYNMAVFPDSLDKLTPSFGYLPGKMPWYFGEKLKALGVNIVNKKAKGECCIDRKLITGDSPDAANEFGQLAAHSLLHELRNLE